MKKKLFWVLYGALFLNANAALANEGQKLEIYAHPEPVNETPVFTKSGEEVRFGVDDSRLRVINLWALWCVSCRKEMPTLDALSEQYRPEDIQFLTAAIGRNDPEKIEKFFQEIGVKNLPVYYDPKQKYAASVSVQALPQTLILNADGEEIARVIGEANYLDPSMKSALDAVLLAQN